jgi:uncharacterized protein
LSTRPVDLAAPVAVALAAAGRRDGIHGDAHWRRVGEAGLFLAEREGVSTHVVLLFAIFHDCRRENDGHDPEHGPRAAALAEQIGHEPLGLSVEELAALAHAMREHDRGRVTGDALVGACWDSDRLDLPRVGITPDPRLLSTGTARDRHTIARFADFRREPKTWEALAHTSCRRFRG